MSNTMRLAPALRFALKDAFRTIGIVMGITFLAFLAAIILISLFNPEDAGSFNSFDTVIFVYSFVGGLIIRTDIRLFIQHGLGRRTAFVACLITMLLTAPLSALGIELLVGITQSVFGAQNNFTIANLYHLIYLFDTIGSEITLSGHLMSILFVLVVFCFMHMLGAFISLTYWHLNRTWTIIVSVAVPLIILSVISLGVGPMGGAFLTLAKLFTNPVSTIVLFALLTCVLVFFNWLLMRRVTVKPIKA